MPELQRKIKKVERPSAAASVEEKHSRVGIIGYPLGHTLSPVMHQAAFDHLVLPITYHAFEVKPEGLAEFMEKEARKPDLLGLNVTIPHKETVIPFLDELSPEAEAIGAVNTVCHTEGRLVGHNTDAYGFNAALILDARVHPSTCRAVIFGAGGAARAVTYALLRRGASSVIIVNRNPERAEQIVQHFLDLAAGRRFLALPADPARYGEELKRCNLIVNATSVGLKGDETPLGKELIPSEVLVYDLVYTPYPTRLLREAKEAGARILGGLGMLLYQGVAAFQLWTKVSAPVQVMRNALAKELGLDIRQVQEAQDLAKRIREARLKELGLEE